MVSALLALASLPLLTAAHAPHWPRKPLLRHNQVREGAVSVDYIHDKRQDGGITGPTTTPGGNGYSCDASKCKLPNCACASTNIPGGIAREETPQFLVFTADDAVQAYTINSVNQFLAQRKNPNGCAPKMTYFTSLNYTNYTMVTDWYVAGNEIADHTMTHVTEAQSDEINGNLIALNSLAGIPFSDLKGFRAPYLNYSVGTLKALGAASFLYDSSATSSIPVTDSGTDAYWPYTLDNGLANDCLSVAGICNGEPKLPGLWEIPMYAIFDERGVEGPHLMDPWLDVDASGANNITAVGQWMRNTFTAHYNNNRQPFGLYTHPIHVAPDVPGVANPTAMVKMINDFIDWAQQQQNVWIVSNEQLLAWVRNPVPASQLNTLPEFQCQVPQVSQKICNGIPSNEEGLLQKCMFIEFPFYTCYGCPVETPTPGNPNPPQASATGQPLRSRLPANCSTPFWDPIGAKCLCQDSACQFVDQSRPIGPNGANLTGGGTGSSTSTASAGPSYVPFNGAEGLLGKTGIAALVCTFGAMAVALMAGVGTVFA
ncbi:hypothetical protein RSOLAG22IIIB_03124 [Rhizoctonia solani]|uniref:NodB homology domain-containing protein n=1 Tax=Rhizoctonia solani TaxID=456999 RepID=A0A0K6FMY5_9AGAM|nr:hypothetical protein RSOLAG22IIIB_03124 [Rhizoctonia solani]